MTTLKGIFYDVKTDFMIGKKYEIEDEGLYVDVTGPKINKKFLEVLENKFGDEIYISSMTYDSITWLKKNTKTNEVKLIGVIDVI